MQPLGMRDGQWTCAQMLGEQAAKMPAGNAKSLSEPFNIAIVQGAVGYEAKPALDGRRRSRPGRRTRRTLGPATQAGTVASLTRSRSGRVKRDVFTFR